MHQRHTIRQKRRYLHLFVMVALFTVMLLPRVAGADDIKVPKDKLHIYLCIGQSNMAGRAPYTEEDAKPIDRCLLLNAEDQWEPASIPLNKYSTVRKDIKMQKMNPSYMFAKTMLAADPSVTLGLVVNAKGGTKIEQWIKDTEFYTQAVKRTKIAMQTGTLKGIIWHQGEANCKDPHYLEKICKLIADLRADLDAPSLPFVCGQINQTVEYPFNTLILKLPEMVPHTGVATTEGLTAMDTWHFNRESMIKLGTRYGETMLKVQAAMRKHTAK
jgi:hypothetical protein